MQEVVVNNTPKVMTIRSGSIQDRIRRDEEELEELLKQARGIENPAEEVVEQPEQEPEEEPKQVETKPEEPEKPVEGWEKRYKDAQRYINSLQTKIKELETSPKKQEGFVPRTKDEVAEWMKKHPEAASFIRTIAVEEASLSSESIKKDMERLERMRIESVIAKTEAAISKNHSDYFDIKNDAKFHKWAEDLPKAMQSVLYETIDDPVGVSKIITLYKAERGDDLSQSDKEDREAASSVRVPSRKTEARSNDQKFLFSESQIQRMSDKEYEAKMEEIEKAIAEGKFLYDLSKNKR